MSERKVTQEQLSRRFREVPQRQGSASSDLILGLDAMDDPVQGVQPSRYFQGYYDSYCFLPLYVLCGEALLVSYLR